MTSMLRFAKSSMASQNWDLPSRIFREPQQASIYYLLHWDFTNLPIKIYLFFYTIIWNKYKIKFDFLLLTSLNEAKTKWRFVIPYTTSACKKKSLKIRIKIWPKTVHVLFVLATISYYKKTKTELSSDVLIK